VYSVPRDCTQQAGQESERVSSYVYMTQHIRASVISRRVGGKRLAWCRSKMGMETSLPCAAHMDLTLCAALSCHGPAAPPLKRRLPTLNKP